MSETLVFQLVFSDAFYDGDKNALLKWLVFSMMLFCVGMSEFITAGSWSEDESGRVFTCVKKRSLDRAYGEKVAARTTAGAKVAPNRLCQSDGLGLFRLYGAATSGIECQ